LPHGIEISGEDCRGCVNCIKSCPTEAIRVINGKVRILEERCIGCGECLRICSHRAISLQGTDWDSISGIRPMALVMDPALFSQFPWPPNPAIMEEILRDMGFEPIVKECALAFDLAAMAQARIMEADKSREMPMISTYCPAVLRLVRMKFQELIPNLAPVESPLETSVDLWKTRNNKSRVQTALVASCPARVAMVEDPVGREASSVDHVISTARLTREILSKNRSLGEGIAKRPRDTRWMNWSASGGEIAHIRHFTEKPLKALAVSGMRNVIGVLQDIELRRLKGVDFIEARACSMGCIGGIANAESCYLSQIKIDNYGNSDPPSAEETAILEELYDAGIWKLQYDITPIESVPLGKNMARAMEKLNEIQSVYAELPHLDCGTCGRPTCRIMAEDIVRGEASLDDCIFRLREKIGKLSGEIHDLSRRLVHTMTPEEKK